MAWLRSHVREEDLVLFAWLIVGPLLLPPAKPTAGSSGTDLVGGLLGLAALCLAAACVGLRTRDGTGTGLMQSGNVAFAVGPLTGAAVFALADTSDKLGLADSWQLLPIVLAIATAVVARLTVAPVTVALRRTLVTPFVLLTSTFFSGFIAGYSDLFDLRVLWPSIEGGQQTGVALILFFGILSTAIFYVMFVFAPRQIAEREGDARQWLARFGLFLVGLVLSASITAVRVG